MLPPASSPMTASGPTPNVTPSVTAIATRRVTRYGFEMQTSSASHARRRSQAGCTNWPRRPLTADSTTSAVRNHGRFVLMNLSIASVSRLSGVLKPSPPSGQRNMKMPKPAQSRNFAFRKIWLSVVLPLSGSPGRAAGVSPQVVSGFMVLPSFLFVVRT